MSEEQDRAAALEQQYVTEYSETEEVLEGLDPDRPDAAQSTEQVKAAAADGGTEAQVDEMARDDGAPRS